jgi:hypothetical protein
MSVCASKLDTWPRFCFFVRAKQLDANSGWIPAVEATGGALFLRGKVRQLVNQIPQVVLTQGGLAMD